MFAILTIVGIAYYFLLYKKPQQNFSSKTNVQEPLYSVNGTDITQVKSKLVPADFLFIKPAKTPEEFKRTLASLDEYTAFWETATPYKETEGKYVQYTSDQGYNPFVSHVSATSSTISGGKNDVVLNIFIEKINDSLTKIQVHFSQKK